MTFGELLTRWAMRGALIFYFATIAGQLWLGPLHQLPARHSSERILRGLWTMACAALWLHVAAAFYYFHHGSHAAAEAETARQTAALLGVSVGAGIYFNYAMMLMWAGDCAWWWIAPSAYATRPRWLTAGVHGYMLFMIINGAIVFESGPTRSFAMAAMIGLLVLVLYRWRVPRNARDVD